MLIKILIQSKRGKRINMLKPLRNNIPPPKVHIKAATKSKYRLGMPGLIALRILFNEFIALNF